MSTRAFSQGKGNTRKNGGQEKDHFYPTPPDSTWALLRVESFFPAGEEVFPRLDRPHIWEPACGDGAMSSVLESAGYVVHSTDLMDRGYGTPRIDFLLERTLHAPTIVTNPPFKLADEFVLHALDIGASTVAILARLAWLEGTNRHKALFSKGKLARVWTFSKRQTLWRGDDPDAKSKGGAIPFAWFIFEANHRGPFLGGWL